MAEVLRTNVSIRAVLRGFFCSTDSTGAGLFTVNVGAEEVLGVDADGDWLGVGTLCVEADDWPEILKYEKNYSKCSSN